MTRGRGRSWQDFAVGERIETGGRTVETCDIHAFAGLTGDFNPIHMDEVAAKETIYGSRIAHGKLTLAIASGQLNQTGQLEGTSLAILGIEAVRFHQPVRAGDTLVTLATVTGIRPSKSSDRGIVTFAIAVRNQTDAIVLTYEETHLFAG